MFLQLEYDDIDCGDDWFFFGDLEEWYICEQIDVEEKGVDENVGCFEQMDQVGIFFCIG